MCPRSSDQFYIVSYYIKWATTSWTHSMCPPVRSPESTARERCLALYWRQTHIIHTSLSLSLLHANLSLILRIHSTSFTIAHQQTTRDTRERLAWTGSLSPTLCCRLPIYFTTGRGGVEGNILLGRHGDPLCQGPHDDRIKPGLLGRTNSWNITSSLHVPLASPAIDKGRTRRGAKIG